MDQYGWLGVFLDGVLESHWSKIMGLCRKRTVKTPLEDFQGMEYVLVHRLKPKNIFRYQGISKLNDLNSETTDRAPTMADYQVEHSCEC